MLLCAADTHLTVEVGTEDHRSHHLHNKLVLLWVTAPACRTRGMLLVCVRQQAVFPCQSPLIESVSWLCGYLCALPESSSHPIVVISVPLAACRVHVLHASRRVALHILAKTMHAHRVDHLSILTVDRDSGSFCMFLLRLFPNLLSN